MSPRCPADVTKRQQSRRAAPIGHGSRRRVDSRPPGRAVALAGACSTVGLRAASASALRCTPLHFIHSARAPARPALPRLRQLYRLWASHGHWRCCCRCCCCPGCCPGSQLQRSCPLTPLCWPVRRRHIDTVGCAPRHTDSNTLFCISFCTHARTHARTLFCIKTASGLFPPSPLLEI